MPGKAIHDRADVVQAMRLGTRDLPLLPDDPFYAWRLLAEGDPWFTVGAIPSSNLLRLKPHTVSLNLDYPGDTVASVAQLSANTEFARRLAARLHRVLER